MNKWLFPKCVVILISGKAGVGKGLFAEILENLLDEDLIFFQRTSFAKLLKECAFKFFNWDGTKDSSGRALLQNLGNIGRIYNQNIWIEKMIDDIVDICGGIFPNVIIVDDWRFQNEANFFLTKPEYFDVKRIRINAPSREALKDTAYYDDISETALDNYSEFDLIVDNENLTINELEIMVRFFYKDLIGE